MIFSWKHFQIQNNGFQISYRTRSNNFSYLQYLVSAIFIKECMEFPKTRPGANATSHHYTSQTFCIYYYIFDSKVYLNNLNISTEKLRRSSDCWWFLFKFLEWKVTLMIWKFQSLSGKPYNFMHELIIALLLCGIRHNMDSQLVYKQLKMDKSLMKYLS